MASLKETGLGIGDFALNLLEQEKTNPQPVSHKAPVRGDVPDIENIKVLQEDVNAVLSTSFGVETKPQPKRNLEEERKQHLKEQIQVKINELKELLNELGIGTGVGNIGINFAGGNHVNRSSRKSKRYKATRKKD